MNLSVPAPNPKQTIPQPTIKQKECSGVDNLVCI